MGTPDESAGYDRLERALEDWLDYLDGGGTDPESFLAGRDPELRALLEPMLAAAPADPPAPRAPARIGGFRIVRELGRGGMGVVFEAEDEALRRRVALKVLGPHFTWSAAGIERFRREGEAAARLHHPGIAQVYGIGHSDGAHWIALELIDGRNLSDVLRGGERIGVTADGSRAVEAAELVAQLGEALDYAHGQNVVHRDVKPHNVLIDTHGRARLVDFGLAKLLDADSLSKTGDFAGSLAYASPEQLAGRSDLDARTDVWSLGVLLYEALSGRRPFEADTQQAIVRAVLTRDPPPLPAARDLQTICAKALEKEPDLRYASAGAMTADLRRFLAHEPIQASPPSTATRVLRLLRRRRAVAASIATGIALVVVTVVFVVRDRDQAEVLSRVVDSAQSTLLELEQMIQGSPQPTSPDEVRRQRLRIERLVAESERLLALQPDSERLRITVARAHDDAGRLYQRLKLEADAIAAHSRAAHLLEPLADENMAARSALAASLHNRHVLQRALGRDVEADRDLEHAMRLWREVVGGGGDSPAVTDARASLATALTNRARTRLGTENAGNDLQGAASLWAELERAGAVSAERLPHALDTSVTLAQQWFQTGRTDRALAAMDTLLRRLETLATPLAQDPGIVEAHARATMLRGEIGRMLGRDDDARADLERAIVLHSELAADGTPDRIANVVEAQFALAAFLVEREADLDRARELLDDGEARCVALADLHEELLMPRHMLARIAGLRANAALVDGSPPESVEASFERAIDLHEKLVEADDRPRFRSDLAEVQGSYGGWLARQDRTAEARGLLDHATDETARLLATAPDHPILRRNLLAQTRHLMSVLDRMRSSDEMVVAAERLRSALPADADALGMALMALDRAISFQPDERRDAFADPLVESAAGWMDDADRRELSWRGSRWIEGLRILPSDPELRSLIEAPRAGSGR